MSVIIVKPTFVDPDNPTPAELAVQTRYQAQLQTVRLLLSPDITAPILAEVLPDTVIGDDGYLRPAERTVLQDSGYSEAQVTALAQDSDELELLVYATQVLLAIDMLSQAAQIIQERIVQDEERHQEIDWEARETRLKAKYREAILALNPSAQLDSIGDPVAFLTKSRKPTLSYNDYFLRSILRRVNNNP